MRYVRNNFQSKEYCLVFAFVDLAVSDKKKRQIDDDQKSKERVLSPGSIWKAP